MPTTMATVHRHPTIPLTKRDSLVMNGSRVSLVSNGSNPNTSKVDEKDIVNTHPDMTAGKKRTPKKVKRTPSYKRALNRQSCEDELDTFSVETRDSKHEIEKDKSQTEDRKKYNTLPIRMAPPPVASSNRSKDSRQKRKAEAKNCNDIQTKTSLHRNVSQKSGTYYPSPDTDEDQRSIQPSRKKKSAFKRVKERLILTFRKDSEDAKHKKIKNKKDKYASPTHRVRPNHDGGTKGFQTPNAVQDNKTAETDRNEFDHDGSKITMNTIDRISEIDEIETISNKGPLPNKGKKSDFNLFQSIRNSFRRKQAPQKYRNQKTQSHEEVNSGIPSGSQSQTTKSHTSSDQSRPSDVSANNDASLPTSQGVRPKSGPINIPPVKDKGHPIEIPPELEDYSFEEEDTISEIFGSIIDPSRATPVGRSSSVRSNGRQRRPDTTQLRLEGLDVCRPTFNDRPTNSFLGFQPDLSPTVEIDGLDFADAPNKVIAGFKEEEEDTLKYHDVSKEEQQKRVDDVARCLAAIGDKIAADKESESSSSEVEGHYHSRRRLSSFEQELMMDLRQYGDDIDKKLFGKDGIKCNISILPIVKNILAAQSYSGFKRIICQELSDTIGWEQVAWYTYLIKTTVCIVGTGKQVGEQVTRRARKYFDSTLKPWVVTRPNGWESIHEETDVESDANELD